MSEQVCGVVFVDDEHHITCSLPQGHAGPHGWRLAPSPAAASGVPLEDIDKWIDILRGVELRLLGRARRSRIGSNAERQAYADGQAVSQAIELLRTAARHAPGSSDPGIVQCRSCGGYHPCLRAIEAPSGKE